MLRLGVTVACAISAQACAGMGMFSVSVTARGSLQSFALFTCMMVILSLIPESLCQSLCLCMFEIVWFFLISFQFRLNLTFYESFYKIISMQVLSLKGCSLCGSHTRALLVVLRMFSPPLPSLPFQACKNCSQLVCVYTAIWHVWHLEDAIYPLKFHIRCFLVKLSRFLVFSNEKNADP